ncbi:hypothetical protein [Mesorhizobium neociceri]|uniref:Uncharacterized protein n=1 Tax=Mesorhizobium neociceri TaxID=1307853 RepID=A0A838AYC8_9HYPH|nr:hypothetical protein [Mesorhizobium neociceri]MBA1139446.1 hypothetical protein [Mesorhizobium neociceri]
MSILPNLRPLVTKDIGAFLNDSDKIRDLVQEATGENPHVNWTNPTLPLGKQISDVLTGLEETKADRWLLTYVLIAALENGPEHDKLRELIVRACPETLITTPKLQQQVERVLADLQQFLVTPVPPNVREEWRLKQTRLQAMVQDTARLFAYKSLHESLHGLKLQLTFGEVLGQATEAHIAIDDALERATLATPLLGADTDEERVELEWMAALKPLGTQLEAAAAAQDGNIERDLIEQVRDLIWPHLIRLNGHVFDAARKLSLPAIVEDPPLDFRTRPEFIDLGYAVHDLKPTVLARALKHRMWQDAEKELPLIDALLDVPGPTKAETINDWFRFKSRILWLAELDPDAGWSVDARTFADQISDAMADAEERDRINIPRENYRKLIAACFFAIGAMLKADCVMLRKVNEPLNAILQELDRV